MVPEDLESQYPNSQDVINAQGQYDQRGQVVRGNQINVAGDYIDQRITRTDARNQHNHTVLRQAVRRFWVDSVLKSSLYNEMLIRLGLESNPDAVDNRPWDLILQQPNQPDRTIADDQEIIDIFDEMGQLAKKQRKNKS